ncbi:hypothetical protein H8M03_10075 [Sphingomonas sabuli]|uniref:Uncharacterized protein n=1 Tax=Sphingomonas sabuli TaxID=2764186 RepID=A0A7G9L155_9SPHN|nr:hypothetical protein [Sphingomonas sabuli]QNM82354.1 hypothetical protein H8M03_10075 [Sphingomonas sabuli]
MPAQDASRHRLAKAAARPQDGVKGGRAVRNLFRNAFVPTESEYRANHAGMNTFFGAVLGFVMAGTERLDTVEFAALLLLVSGIVIAILYVSASRSKYIYAGLAVAMTLSLPRVFRPVLDDGESIPQHLMATLIVWTMMSLFVEAVPRRPDEEPVPPPAP